MKSSEQDFIIPFIGMKTGTYTFEYKVNDTFFESMEYSLIHKGDLNVTLEFEKKENMMTAHFWAEGMVSTNCDRCDTPMELAISGEFKLIYKFGLEESEDESLVVLHPEAYELDVSEAIYELAIVSLPARMVHPAGECDEEMWKLIQQYTVNSDEEDDDWDDEDWEDEDDEPGPDDFDPKDPKWAVLRNLN
ncbi:MAG: DUF177 domain-containing protein [Crocinitomicaceae bacterium]|nr:MAG: DUF177 domain-containing protein [Crocinitomicaceae bacterium]